MVFFVVFNNYKITQVSIVMNGFSRRSSKGIFKCAVTGAGDERVITKETKKALLGTAHYQAWVRVRYQGWGSEVRTQ